MLLFMQMLFQVIHSAESPVLYIGQGTTTFTEHHGNFDIEDTVERRIPLDVISRNNASSNPKMTFTAKTDTSLQV